MKQENITYTVDYFYNNKPYKNKTEEVLVSFKKKNNAYISLLKMTDVYEKIKTQYHDVVWENIDVQFNEIKNINGTSHIGIPSKISVNLNVYQVRRDKLAAIDIDSL